MHADLRTLVKTSETSPQSSDSHYAGFFGLLPVPYSQGVFNFHWFNFYNSLCFQIIGGAPIVLLAKDLGASSLILGIIAAFLPLMTILQLPAARHLGRYSYRSFTLMGWMMRTLFIATSAVIPLLFFLSRDWRLALLVGSLFFFYLLRGISSAAFLPWVTSMVGGEMRGRFISIDHSFTYGGAFLTMLLSSLMMSGHVVPWRYSLVLCFSLLGALISIYYMRRIPDREHHEEKSASAEPVSLRTIFSQKPLRNSIIFSLLFGTVGGGLGVFPVEYLRIQAHFSPSAIYALTSGTFLAPLLILQMLGHRIDRFGSLPTIRGSIILFTLVLAVWFTMAAEVITPSWQLVLLLNVVGGMAVAAFNMASLHLGMSVVPEYGKNHYFAVTTVITGLGLGIVPVLWGWLLDTLGNLDHVAGPFHFTRHSVYFLGITLLCASCLLASRILIDPREHKSES
jgi:MFS family permease